MVSLSYPPCPECHWAGKGLHPCDPQGARNGNPFSYEKWFTKKVFWLIVTLFLVPILFALVPLLGARVSDSSADGTDVPGISDTSVARSLTDAESAAGYNYDDTMNFGYKFLSGKEEKKHPCYGDCVVVKVLALTDCKNIRVNGEIRKSSNIDAKIYRQARGWVGGSKTKAIMHADQIKYVKLSSTKSIAGGVRWWVWVNDITCTPLN